MLASVTSEKGESSTRGKHMTAYRQQQVILQYDVSGL